MLGLREPTMLYRTGTEARIHNVHVDTIIVDAHEVDDYLDQGWYRTPTEAKREEHAGHAERNAMAERERLDAEDAQRRERQAQEDNERRSALDAQEQRLVAMQAQIEERFAELERATAAAQKTTAKTGKPGAESKAGEQTGS